jgi:hypothetical protein
MYIYLVTTIIFNGLIGTIESKMQMETPEACVKMVEFLEESKIDIKRNADPLKYDNIEFSCIEVTVIK